MKILFTKTPKPQGGGGGGGSGGKAKEAVERAVKEAIGTSVDELPMSELETRAIRGKPEEGFAICRHGDSPTRGETPRHRRLGVQVKPRAGLHVQARRRSSRTNDRGAAGGTQDPLRREDQVRNMAMKQREMSGPEIRARVRVTQGKPIATHTISDLPTGTRFRAPRGDIRFTEARLASVDFSGAVFDRFVSVGSEFDSCNFSNVRFGRDAQAVLGAKRPTVYRSCGFDRADMRNVDPGQSRFERCTFRGTRMEKWFSFAAEFVDCVFEGSMSECTFYGKPNRRMEPTLDSDREDNEFRGNDFSLATLRHCVFRDGIDLDAQRFPIGPEYVWLRSFRRRIAPTRAALVRRLRGEELERAIRYLNMLEATYREQSDVFLGVHDTKLPGWLDVLRLLASTPPDVGAPPTVVD